jgi:hypothetical protein
MNNIESSDVDLQPFLKKRRISAEDDNQTQKPQLDPEVAENNLPPDDLVDSLVEIYFVTIHPWIPILHVKQFREKMANPVQRPKLATIFHAIVSLCVRFSKDERLGDPNVRARYSKFSRNTVILQSMESFSVENLQALVICAFDTVCIHSWSLTSFFHAHDNSDWKWPWPIRMVNCRKHDADC